jgi:hypothetical protein
MEVDPEKYGFKIDDTTFDRIKKFYSHHKLVHHLTWSRSQIPDKIEYDHLGSKEFFEWFRSFEPYQEDVWFYRKIYYNLPYRLAMILNILYSRFGISIHENSPYIPQRIIDELEGYEARLHTREFSF